MESIGSESGVGIMNRGKNKDINKND